MTKMQTIIKIMKCKCPKCRIGDLFETKNPYNLARAFIMPEHCKHCSHKFEMEPGFWYGAMYFSYLLGFVLSFPLVVFLFVSDNTNLLTGIIIVSTFLVLIAPILFRYSRAFWIYIFVPYSP